VDLGTYKGLLGSHLTRVRKFIKQREDIEIQKLVISEDDFILQENSVDMIISSLDLHWINDLPRLFSNIFYSLKQDGVFIGSMFGGQTLFELRCSLQMAEMEREGGFGLHISPLITAQDIGSLLNRSGYTMLTIDTDEIIVHYPTMFELMYDLKGMAENNAAILAKTHLNRDSLLAAASIYQHLYGKSSEKTKSFKPDNDDQNSCIPATFQIFYFIGWKPHPSQPTPAKRGSATVSIKDIPNIEKLLKNSEIIDKN
ncbi:methyltransferase-like protein, partial [Euroglyphus maynei]